MRLSPFSYHTTQGDLNINSNIDLGNARYRWNNIHGDGDLYGNQQYHWVAALQGKVSLIPTAEIALNTMLISEGIYLSDKLGREVSADEVVQASVSTAVQI